MGRGLVTEPSNQEGGNWKSNFLCCRIIADLKKLMAKAGRLDRKATYYRTLEVR